MVKWEVEFVIGIAAVAACVLLVLVVKLCVGNRERGGEELRILRYQSQDRDSSWNSSGDSIKIARFDWSDYPALMSEALENGWAAFALFQLDDDRDRDRRKFRAETRWEIGPGTELMQVLRCNPGLPDAEISARSLQFFKSALPLPGPFLGPHSYPQASYFEITVLAPKQDHDHTPPSAKSLESSDRFERIVAVGLAAGSSFRDRASISYYSNGQILLNGVVYTDERFQREPWIPALRDSTVGCGFNPASRIVFFTLNGEMTCQADCSRAEDFGAPLHAGFLCNYDATMIVNLGQSAFEFAPENAWRRPDPGNHRPWGNEQRQIHDDSGDLFSQRLDGSIVSPVLSQDLRRAAPSEAESELFEIVLDADGNEKLVHL